MIRAVHTMVRPWDVDIGVIYTHEREFIGRLVTTLAESCRSLRARLVLIDNCSVEGVDAWRPLFPATRVLRNDRRLGYAENLNRVLEVARARYVLLLNTDMYFDPAADCLGRMVRFLDRHSDCGLAACRLLHDDGSDARAARSFQSPAVIAARRLGLARWLGGTMARYLHTDRRPDESYECDWVSGCFLMLRREAAAAVGPFDTGFRKYFEDVDMCLRVWRAGWSVMFNGDTYCYHLEQRASRRLISRDAWRHAQSYLRFVRKWGLHPQRRLEAQPSPARRAA